MNKETTTLTGFSGADMSVFTNKKNKWSEDGEGVAFELQAITWSHEKIGSHISDSLVLSWAPNPISGPHNIIITLNREKELGEHITQVVFEAQLLDKGTGEPIGWSEAELATVYDFVARDFTGWISK
jgi:hypothetical protein